MTEARKKLGRGLDALLSSTKMEEAEREVSHIMSGPSSAGRTGAGHSIINLNVDEIQRNPQQPRASWDDSKLYELAESIRANGIIQPIIVRDMGGAYQLIAGERRLRAAKMAGLSTIPAIVKDASEEQMLEWALVENIHRADLNPLERARAYRRYIQSFNLTQEETAKRLGEDRATIANYMRLLELCTTAQDYLSAGKISMGHARALLSLKDHQLQTKTIIEIHEKSLSVRETEKLVKSIVKSEPFNNAQEPKPQMREKQPHLLDLEKEFGEVLATRVQIKTKGRRSDRGVIQIEFYSLDDFDRIQSKLLST